MLSDEERAQFNRFHLSRDARDYAAAHDLLRRRLSRDRGVAPDRWRFGKDTRGKPFLIGDGARCPSFSLSHTRGMVACAVSEDVAVGVDVECIDRVVDIAGIAARFFSAGETAQLLALDGAARRSRFFELWTLKEALAKACGTGMALDAADPDGEAWAFGLYAPDPRYRLAVAVRRSGEEAPQLILRSDEAGA